MMSTPSRQEYVRTLKPRYLKTKRKDRSALLDDGVSFTGYHRKYLIRLLSPRTDLFARKTRAKKKRKQTYGSDVMLPLIKIWKTLNYPCSVRLKSQLPEMIDALKRHKELTISNASEQKLLSMSKRTMDRRLAHEKDVLKVKNKRAFCTTKPGTLKSKIPIRKGTDWDDSLPGYQEIDTVAHNGGDPSGEFVYTLNSTDIYSGWTESVAGLGKSKHMVIEVGFKGIIVPSLPFPLLGVDGDSGSELINDLLYKFCKENNIEFTRSRPYHSNDGCHIEEKNWTHIRKIVGYGRMDTQTLAEALNDLYRNELRLYMNFFQPHMKCVEKIYTGSKVKKKHVTKTPYRWLMESDAISPEKKQWLQDLYYSLNPIQLKKEIDRKRSIIAKLAEASKSIIPEA